MFTNEATTATHAASETVLQHRLNRLSFGPELEPAFRKDYEDSSLGWRLPMLIIAILAVALTPVYDALLLHPPAAFIPAARWIQFGIEIPGLLVGLLCCLPPLRRYLPFAIVLGAMTTGGGLMAQRVIGAAHDYFVPFDFAAITIAAIYTMGRLRFQMFFPWALLILVVSSVVEIHTFGPVAPRSTTVFRSASCSRCSPLAAICWSAPHARTGFAAASSRCWHCTTRSPACPTVGTSTTR